MTGRRNPGSVSLSRRLPRSNRHSIRAKSFERRRQADPHRRRITQGAQESDLRRQQRGLPRQERHTRGRLPAQRPTPICAASPPAKPVPSCGAALRIDTAVEIGHIFKLGYKYSESMGARVLDRNGKEVMPIMGCYGIGIERILTAIVEQNNDDNGFWLSPQVAPFEVVVVLHQRLATTKSVPTAEDIAMAPRSRRIRRVTRRPGRTARRKVQGR